MFEEQIIPMVEMELIKKIIIITSTPELEVGSLNHWISREVLRWN